MKEVRFMLPDISEVEIDNVVEVLRSGWITTGPKTKLLEKKLATFVGNYPFDAMVSPGQTNGQSSIANHQSPRCVCLGSATAAMELSLRLLGIGCDAGGSADDEVITCAYTYTASASVINHVRARIVLVDCSDKDGSIEMDYTKLEAAITENTKAIIPVDIAGVPCDYDRIFEIVEKKKSLFVATSELQNAIGRIAVIADGAHALGASYKGTMVGSVADFTAFSFHATKNFSTAEGGALCWNHIDGIDDSNIYHRIQLFSLHGQSKDAYAKNQMGAWEYDIIGTWYKCNMTDIAAAIGLGQFERYPGMLARRREIIERYDAAFKPLGIKVLDHYTDERISSGHVYITRIPGINREQANEIMQEMAQAGIATNVHFKPLPMHTAYKNLGFDIKDYLVAYAKFENEITLPLHTKMSDEDVVYVIETYIAILHKYFEGK
ncbi:MAG: DegT/DnrJ/EryC1/StrS family aminotransferase [Bacteroidales bacterium]|nr:DegT/DnrJ/EryC1/StrS family aminotransferase [Bacteroidales bacterium]